ncbi:MAG: hypothetical protein LBN20_05600 [Endomicrobium sp.]|jgi:hypothetical protein|nr:hypothetical protein [Endomicrobium sp.]
MKRIWQVLNENWFEIIVNKWREIPSVYKKSFLIVFVGVNIAFAFDTISFIIGDHDWTRLIKSIGIHSVGSGRFSILYVNYLLTGNNILPILTNIYAFFIFSLSSVLLCI